MRKSFDSVASLCMYILYSVSVSDVYVRHTNVIHLSRSHQTDMNWQATARAKWARSCANANIKTSQQRRKKKNKKKWKETNILKNRITKRSKNEFMRAIELLRTVFRAASFYGRCDVYMLTHSQKAAHSIGWSKNEFSLFYTNRCARAFTCVCAPVGQTRSTSTPMWCVVRVMESLDELKLMWPAML